MGPIFQVSQGPFLGMAFSGDESPETGSSGPVSIMFEIPAHETSAVLRSPWLLIFEGQGKEGDGQTSNPFSAISISLNLTVSRKNRDFAEAC